MVALAHDNRLQCMDRLTTIAIGLLVDDSYHTNENGSSGIAMSRKFMQTVNRVGLWVLLASYGHVGR